jgi:hypothetical protein
LIASVLPVRVATKTTTVPPAVTAFEAGVMTSACGEIEPLPHPMATTEYNAKAQTLSLVTRSPSGNFSRPE